MKQELANRALLLIITAFALGCGPSVDPVFSRTIAAADRAQTAGRHIEAAHEFEHAAEAAREVSDRNYALSLAATSYLKANDRADAARILDALIASPPVNGTVAVRARFDRALLALETDENESLDALERFVVEHPESALARRALAIVLDRRASSDLGERTKILERIAPRVRGTELEERVTYSLALTHDEKGENARARDELIKLAHDFPYPKGALFDDALFRASEIDERLGNYRQAITDLEVMLKARETTSLIGTYERPKYLPAAMRIAVLYRDRLADPERARDAYFRVFNDFAYSTSRDDALFEAALLSRKLGDPDTACSAMRKLLRSLPDSRYTACATRVCPSIGEGATKPCPDYIVTRIDNTRS